MALQGHTKNKLDVSLLDQVATELATKIVTPGALSADGDRKLRGSLSDEGVADIVLPAIASGVAVTAAANGDVAYARAVMALAMSLGSYDAARDFLANPRGGPSHSRPIPVPFPSHPPRPIQDRLRDDLKWRSPRSPSPALVRLIMGRHLITWAPSAAPSPMNRDPPPTPSSPSPSKIQQIPLCAAAS